MNKISRFVKTIAGKTFIFALCIFSVCILILSVIAACFMLSCDFYTKTETDLFETFALNDMKSDGYRTLYDYLSNNDIDYSNSNLVYRLTDASGNIISESKEYNAQMNKEYEYNYGVLKDDNKVTDLYYRYDLLTEDKGAEYYTVIFKLKNDMPEKDIYAFKQNLVHIMYNLRFAVYITTLISLILIIFCFVTLMCVSARRPDTDKLVAGPFNRVPFDIITLIMVLIGIIIIRFLYDFSDVVFIIWLSVSAVVYCSLLLGYFMSFSARIKQKNLLSNTLIFYTLRFLRKTAKTVFALMGKIPLIWRTVSILGVITLAEFTVIMFTWWESDNLLLCWIAEKIILIPVIMYIAFCLRNLSNSGKALASGHPDYRTDVKYMIWDFKRHGENLNSIAEGINIAVDKQMKSERMKTELITNVSHDIKTPLTSIINYATLIGKETCDNKIIAEYSAVLVRQSERLKKLIEDLVEASKASSGNLDVELTMCDASVFITQASGEYAERLENAGLTLIVKQPETPVYIMADGRRMWRIFDNLINNICKYALSGTRVYLTLEKTGKNVIFNFKNISGVSLDISEEELMERFVRGDRSRSTEGNGLGLSIAKSLAELQGGSLKIQTDGDLFKATLTFPTI